MELEDEAPGVEPEAALAWWADVREGPHDHAFVPGATRRVLHADERGFEVVDVVRWLGVPVFSEHTVARVRGNTVQLTGENTFARFEARYRFEHTFDPEGTRLVLAGTVDLKGPLSWVEGLARPVVERILAWDTAGHVEQMVDALAQAPAAEADRAAARPRP